MASIDLPLALPRSLNFISPPQIPDSVKATVRNIQATNSPIIVGTSDIAIANAFTANGSGNNAISFNSSQVSFVIPTGKSKQFLDAKETTVSFRLKWEVTTTSDATGSSMQLISSGASWFSSVQLNSGSVSVDKIDNYDILQHMLIAGTVNFAERFALTSMGCDTDTITGHDIPTAAGVYYFNYCIPLLSLIGLNSPDQLLPIGDIDGLELQLTTANNIPIATYATNKGTVYAAKAPILDSFKLNCRIVDLGDTGYNMLYKTIPSNEIAMKATSYLSSVFSMPTNINGDYQMIHGIKARSIKSVFYAFSQGQVPAVSPSGYFDSFNIGLTKAIVSAGGMTVPQTALDPTRRPQEAFMNFVHALGGASLKSMGGVLDRSIYGSSLYTTSLADNSIVIPTAGGRGAIAPVQVNKYPSGHYLGFNLEQVFNANTLFAGVNTMGTNGIQLDVTLSNALTTSINCYCFALVDVVILINRQNRTISIFK